MAANETDRTAVQQSGCSRLKRYIAWGGSWGIFWLEFISGWLCLINQFPHVNISLLIFKDKWMPLERMVGNWCFGWNYAFHGVVWLGSWFFFLDHELYVWPTGVKLEVLINPVSLHCSSQLLYWRAPQVASLTQWTQSASIARRSFSTDELCRWVHIILAHPPTPSFKTVILEHQWSFPTFLTTFLTTLNINLWQKMQKWVLISKY